MIKCAVIINELHENKTESFFSRLKALHALENPLIIHENLNVILYVLPSAKTIDSKFKFVFNKFIKKYNIIFSSYQKDNILMSRELKTYFLDTYNEFNYVYILKESFMKNITKIFENKNISKDYKEKIIIISDASKNILENLDEDFLKKFKQILLVNPEKTNDVEKWTESFINETGVPVCITDSFDALKISNYWIAYNKTEQFGFKGIKYDVSDLKVIDYELDKTYKYGWSKNSIIASEFGQVCIKLFGYQTVIAFLLQILSNFTESDITQCEKELGVNFVLEKKQENKRRQY